MRTRRTAPVAFICHANNSHSVELELTEQRITVPLAVAAIITPPLPPLVQAHVLLELLFQLLELLLGLLHLLGHLDRVRCCIVLPPCLRLQAIAPHPAAPSAA